MQITLPRTTLLKPLQMISGVVERRHTVPILANVLMIVRDNQLLLIATDMEIELIGTLPLEQAAEPSATTVSARKLLDICRTLPEDALLELVSEGDHLIVRSGKSRFVLATLPAEDFPSVESLSFKTEFTLSQAKLKSLLNKVHFAMGQQDVRHYLNGALINIHQGIMKCVATDGHRLAVSSISDASFSDANVQIILPRKSVLELMRLLDASNENNVTVYPGDNHFRIISPDFIFTSKLMNVQYPDYSKLIPRSIENTVTTSREALKQALTRASILLNEKCRNVILYLAQNKLRIIANTPEQEEAEELIHLDYQGNDMEFCFNATYLLDVVSALGGEDLRVSFGNTQGGFLMEAPEKDDSLYVVMPMIV